MYTNIDTTTTHTEANAAGNRYDVGNLSSRKLFELLAEHDELALSQQQLLTIERELLQRRHYLHELKALGRSV